jgi:hypothetical protein
MEQRRLRLGDILDDYCPRERRVTNHAVVAMVEETVKQTRCTTCDAEHPYKGGQAPRRRKKDGPASLYKEVLAGKPDSDLPPLEEVPEVFAAAGNTAVEGDSADTEVDGNVMAVIDGPPAPSLLSRPAPAPRRELVPDLPSPILEDADQRAPEPEDGPVHRQLIRATLPRIEGQKEERKPTDFTIRQAGGRGNNAGNHFRGGGGGSDRSRTGGRGGPGPGGPGGNPGNTGSNAGHRGNGHRPPGGPRFAGARSGQGPGSGPGQGQGRGPGGGFRSTQQPRHSGRKRSR